MADALLPLKGCLGDVAAVDVSCVACACCHLTVQPPCSQLHRMGNDT